MSLHMSTDVWLKYLRHKVKFLPYMYVLEIQRWEVPVKKQRTIYTLRISRRILQPEDLIKETDKDRQISNSQSNAFVCTVRF